MREVCPIVAPEDIATHFYRVRTSHPRHHVAPVPVVLDKEPATHANAGRSGNRDLRHAEPGIRTIKALHAVARDTKFIQQRRSERMGVVSLKAIHKTRTRVIERGAVYKVIIIGFGANKATGNPILGIAKVLIAAEIVLQAIAAGCPIPGTLYQHG